MAVICRCPFCFLDLSAARAAFRCTSDGCTQKADQMPGQFSPAGVQRGALTVAASPATSVACSACGAQAFIPACPKCGYDLPPGWLDVQTTCLVMAGGRTSGKSIYIAVLKKQVEELTTLLGGAFEYGSALTQLTFEQYYERYIFEERKFMPPTASVGLDTYQREPLVFRMGSIAGRQQILVLRDVAGEDLENRSVAAPNFDFTSFVDADAILFLFDPMMIR